METTNHHDEMTIGPIASPATLEAFAPQSTAGASIEADSGALPPSIDELPPDDEDVETKNWRREILHYVAEQATPFKVADVWEHGLHMLPGSIERADQMRIAEILRSLGYDRQQRRVDGERQNLWSRVAAPAADVSGAVEASVTKSQQPAAVEPSAAIETNAAVEPSPASRWPASGETAAARCAHLRGRESKIKAKLAEAQAALRNAQGMRKQASLASLDGGAEAEGRYHKAVETERTAREGVEQLTAALAQIGDDIKKASLAEAIERRTQQCERVRDAARVAENYGPRIEALLTEIGKTVAGYLRDVNEVFSMARPVMTGDLFVSMPMTEPVSCALMGQFLRSAGLEPAFFTELTSHGLNGLLRYESPSQIVSYQLRNIVDRLVDNYWQASPGYTEEEAA